MGQSSPEAKKAWLERNKDKRPEINRNCRLRAFYGITPDQYQDMYDAQEGKCAICKNEFSSSIDTHLDHDHDTRWVRGILCSNCNLGGR